MWLYPAMGHDEPESPEPHFGDHPHGAYWSAIRPEGAEERAVDDEEHYSYDGTTLRIMWDEDAGPLWGDEGLLSEDAQWMRRALRLSDTLIDDLLNWKQDMTSLYFRISTENWDAWSVQKRRLNDRGEALAERLNAEVGEQFRVWYHA